MSPLLDKEEIILRLQNLKRYLRILELLKKIPFKEIEGDPFKTGALLHYLQLSAEVSIDIGEMIIAAENFEIPDEAARIFHILGKEKILPKRFADVFSSVARFRNLLVHEYIKIDMHKVYVYLQNETDQFYTYASYIGKYLKKRTKARKFS